MVALNGDMRKADEGIAPWRIRQNLQCGDSFIGFLFRTFLRPLQRTAGRHGFKYRVKQMTPVTLLDSAANHCRLIRGTVMHSV